MATDDWAKKYLDDLNKKLNIPSRNEPKPEPSARQEANSNPSKEPGPRPENRGDRSGQERQDHRGDGRRDKRRRRGRGRDGRSDVPGNPPPNNKNAQVQKNQNKPAQQPPQQPKVRHANGFVLQIDGGRYQVMSENRILLCSIDPGVVRNGPLYVGDKVRVVLGQREEGRIDKYEPRQNFVTCPSRGGDQVLAANINQVVLVVSVKEPVLRTDWLDRHLVVCERRGFKPILCCSKIDLADDNVYLEQMEYYRRMGYRVVYVSTALLSSLHDVRNLLKGKTTLLTGHSGVGKSSIIEALSAGEKVKNIALAEHSEKPAEEDYVPTSKVVCRRLESGGYVIDTPGIIDYEFASFDKKDLRKYYRDFRHYNFQCALPDCIHTDESGCSVKDAVESGDIMTDRYETYLKILEGLY